MKNTRGGKDFVSGAIIYTLSALLIQGINFILTPVFTRIMPQSQYGIFSIYLLGVAACTILIGLQANTSFNSASIEYNDDEFHDFFSNTMVIPCFNFIIILLVIIMYGEYLSDKIAISTQLIFLMVIHAFFSCYLNYFSIYFICKGMQLKYLIFSGIYVFVTTVCSLVFVIILPGEKAFLRGLGATIGAAIGTLIGFILVRCRFPKISLCHLSFSLKICLPLAVFEFSQLIFTQFNKHIIYFFKSVEQLAIFAFCFSIANISFIISNALNSAWVPWYFKNLKSGNTEKISKLSSEYIITFSFISSGLILVCKEVAQYLAPPEYWSGFNILPILFAGGFFNFLFYLVSNYQIYLKKSKYIPRISILISLISIPLNIITIKLFGVLGAAVVICFCHFLQFFLNYSVCHFKLRDFSISLYPMIIGTIIITIAVAFSYMFDTLIIVRWIVATILFILMLFNIRKMLQEQISYA